MRWLGLLFLLIPSLAYGSFDFSSFSEVDPNNHISATADTVTVTGLTRNEDAYAYKDYGVGYWAGTFTHDFVLNIAADGGNNGLSVAWALTNALDDFNDFFSSGQHGLFVNFYESSLSTFDLTLSESHNNNEYYQSYGGLQRGTDYYVRLSLNSTGTYGTAYLKIYLSSVDRLNDQNAVGSVSLPLHQNAAFRYLFAAMSYNTGSASATSFTVGNDPSGLDLTNVAGFSDSAQSLPLPPQSTAWFDGKQSFLVRYQGSGTSAKPTVSYGEDGEYSPPELLPDIEVSFSDGAQIDTFSPYRVTYGSYAAVQANPSSTMDGASFYRENDDAGRYPHLSGTTKSQYISAETTFSSSSVIGGGSFDIKSHPSTILDANDHVWVSGRTSAAGTSGDIKVFRQSAPYNFNNEWEAPKTLRVGVAQGMAQLVAYEDGDVGALYSSGNALYYDHWSFSSGTWSGEETVTTDLDDWYLFRGVVAANKALIVIWRSGSAASDLAYRIREGSWEAAGVAANDLGGTTGQAYFTSQADVGKDESAIASYWDGTDIVDIVWDGSSWSGKTVRVEDPDLKSDRLTAPRYDAHKALLYYHTSDGALRESSYDLAPIQYSNQGLLLSKFGHLGQSTATNSQQVSYSGYTLHTWTGRDHRGWAAITNSSNMIVAGPIPTSKRYWDLHNESFPTIGPNGIVTLSAGGRFSAHFNSTSFEWFSIKQSNYPLGTAEFNTEFTENLTAWEDISPPNSEVADWGYATGRGYQRLFKHSAGDYLVYGRKFGLEVPGTDISVRSRRNGAWDDSIPVVDLADYPNEVMINWLDGAMIDDNGTPKIAIPWMFTDKSTVPEVSGGSIVRNHLLFIVAIPDGSGGWLLEKADGTSLTVPVDNTSAELIEDDSLYYHRVWGGVTWLDTDTPCVVYARCNKEPPNQFAISSIVFAKWNGTEWQKVVVETEGFVWDQAPKVTVADGVIYIVSQKVINGVSEIVKYVSFDRGVTFTEADQVTFNSAHDNYNPLISENPGIGTNLLWHLRRPYYSEVLAQPFTAVDPTPFSRMFLGM